MLGVPKGEGWIQHGCLPMGYPLGKWGVPVRKPLAKVAFHNQWGTTPPYQGPPPKEF